MNTKEVRMLVEPIFQLTGYCRSADSLEPDSRLKEWAAHLIQLAERLEAVWNVAATAESSVERSDG